MEADFGAIAVVWVLAATIVAGIAYAQGRHPVEWFLASVVFSPLLAFVALILTAGRAREARGEPVDNPPYMAERGPCPRCGESIPLAASVCRFCGLDLVEHDRRIGDED